MKKLKEFEAEDADNQQLHIYIFLASLMDHSTYKDRATSCMRNHSRYATVDELYIQKFQELAKQEKAAPEHTVMAIDVSSTRKEKEEVDKLWKEVDKSDATQKIIKKLMQTKGWSEAVALQRLKCYNCGGKHAHAVCPTKVNTGTKNNTDKAEQLIASVFLGITTIVVNDATVASLNPFEQLLSTPTGNLQGHHIFTYDTNAEVSLYNHTHGPIQYLSRPIRVNGVAAGTILETYCIHPIFGPGLLLPSHPTNVLSQRILLNEGFLSELSPDNMTLTLTRDTQCIIAPLIGSFYTIDLSPITVAATTIDTVQDFHRELAHPGVNAMLRYVSSPSVENCPFTPGDIKAFFKNRQCGRCLQGKHLRIHQDIVYPRNAGSVGQYLFIDFLIIDKRFYLVIVDGYSNYSTVYPMERKSTAEFLDKLTLATNMYSKYGHHIREIFCDSESSFVAADLVSDKRFNFRIDTIVLHSPSDVDIGPPLDPAVASIFFFLFFNLKIEHSFLLQSPLSFPPFSTCFLS